MNIIHIPYNNLIIEKQYFTFNVLFFISTFDFTQ